jgi:hypothetical protein
MLWTMQALAALLLSPTPTVIDLPGFAGSVFGSPDGQRAAFQFDAFKGNYCRVMDSSGTFGPPTPVPGMAYLCGWRDEKQWVIGYKEPIIEAPPLPPIAHPGGFHTRDSQYRGGTFLLRFSSSAQIFPRIGFQKTLELDSDDAGELSIDGTMLVYSTRKTGIRINVFSAEAGKVTTVFDLGKFGIKASSVPLAGVIAGSLIDDRLMVGFYLIDGSVPKGSPPPITVPHLELGGASLVILEVDLKRKTLRPFAVLIQERDVAIDSASPGPHPLFGWPCSKDVGLIFGRRCLRLSTPK